MSQLKSTGLLLLVVSAGVACHTRPPAVAPSVPPSSPPAVVKTPPPPPAPPAAVAAPSTLPLSEAELFRRKSLDQLNAEHPLSDAFFDYDQNTLREDARQSLQRDAQWLAKWPETRIRIDGYCDERGSAEYNLALGDRRSETVREYLTGLGIRPERIEARSLGKEAPFCRDTGESCWSQNRRGHLVITAK
jgi:peptidoglycan-associated lipoprotein